jgi:erythromycin esterase
LAVACLACLAAAIPAAAADDLAALQKTIEAQYARLDAAMKRKHPSPFATIAASDIRFVYADGKEWDLARWTGGWRQTTVALETLAIRSTLESIAIEGGTVRAVVRTTLDRTLGKEGSTAKIRDEETRHDTWVRVGTEWRLRYAVTLHGKTWLNDRLTADNAGVPPLHPAHRDAIVGELRARAIPVKTVKAGVGFDDLAALDEIVGDARVIALGEATHGTAEFFRIKHRLFEYLVEKKGFTVLAFETNWPGNVEFLDRHIKTGAGSPHPAPGAWRTREMRDFIRWMRAYNSAPGRAKMLSISGFDIHGSEQAAQCVIEAFARLGTSEAEIVRRHYAGIRVLPFFYGLPDDERESFRANAAAALARVESQREALLRFLTAAEYRRVHQCATIVVQATLEMREQAMAENIKWLAEVAYPDEKIVLWAHNFHVTAAPHQPGLVPMGHYLRQTFGDRVRLLGFAFDRGEVRALERGKSGPGPIKVVAAAPNSAEAVLRSAGLPRFILDLRSVPAEGPLGGWLARGQLLRNFDWVYDPDDTSYIGIVLSQAFDALVFIEESTATVALK